MVISGTDGLCARYDYMYQIWPSVQDMTICTRYDHLYRIWPYVLDMIICTRYDYLCQIWLFVWSYLVQMVISGTDGLISGTDSNIWYR
jgi:hypothetical protein